MPALGNNVRPGRKGGRNFFRFESLVYPKVDGLLDVLLPAVVGAQHAIYFLERQREIAVSLNESSTAAIISDEAP